MLYFDPGTQLFVSREAVGKPPPISVQRVNDNRVVLEKLIEKYGANGRSHPDLAKHPVLAAFHSAADILADTDLAKHPVWAAFHRVLDSLADTDLAEDPDFAPFSQRSRHPRRRSVCGKRIAFAGARRIRRAKRVGHDS